jgi:thymidylate synthase ThyX
VPNGYNRRVLMTLNLRQAFHLIELRTAPNAHFSVRRTAAQMAEAIRRVHPRLAGFMRLAGRPEAAAVEAEFFAAVAAR